MNLFSKLYPFTITIDAFGNGKASIVFDDNKPFILKNIFISGLNRIFKFRLTANKINYYSGSGQNILSFFDETLSGDSAPLDEIFPGGTVLEIELFDASGLDPYECAFHVYEVK